jgi:hypothetical protein
MSPECLLQALGFPEDTMFHDIYVDSNTGYIILIVGHPDIPTRDNEKISDMEPVFGKQANIIYLKEWRIEE